MWKFHVRYWWNKLLITLGIKRDEIYYIGGKTALPAPLIKKKRKNCSIDLQKEIK